MNHTTKLTGFPLQRKPAFWVALILPILLLPSNLQAGEPATRTDWQVIAQPAILKPANAEPLAGSEEILLTPAVYIDWSWREMPAAGFAELGVAPPEYTTQSLRNLLPLLEDLEPQYYRDAEEVIEYGILRAEADPRLAALILLPEFYQQFEPVFGPDFLVVIPNTNHIFLFPRLASTLEQHTAMLLRQFEHGDNDTAIGLSKEIFVITAAGPVVMGRLLDPRTDPVELFTGETLEKPEEIQAVAEEPFDPISKLRP